MILTAEEISEITRKVRPKAQAKVLSAMGFEFKLRLDGTLVVSREHAELVMSGARPPSRKAKKAFTINNQDGTTQPTIA
jgi:hypothetical protein